MTFIHKYILIPKENFNHSAWKLLYMNRNFERKENWDYVISINKPYAMKLSLNLNDSKWSDTNNELSRDSYFDSNGIPYLHNEPLLKSGMALYAIKIENDKLDDSLSHWINNNPVVIFSTEDELLNYKSEQIFNHYNKLLKQCPAPITKDSIRNEIIGEMLSKPISYWVENNIDKDYVQGVVDTYAQKLMEEINTPVHITKFRFGHKLLNKLYHKQFGDVLKLIQLKEPLFIYGNAGSGKTKICIDAAEALQLEYRTISVNEQSTKTDFLGYFDAHSNLIRTPFRDMYENGGVFILDEIDAGNPNVLTVLNSALSNGVMSFPDGMVSKHENFICICTANTTGDTADIKYVGRNILDAATLDRFIRLHIDYDRALENALISSKTANVRDKLLEIISSLETNSEEHILSSRTVLQIDKLLSIKIPVKEAVKLATNFDDHILNQL